LGHGGSQTSVSGVVAGVDEQAASVARTVTAGTSEVRFMTAPARAIEPPGYHGATIS
jgi:hypothetical protein